jgi:hypothetical protein
VLQAALVKLEALELLVKSEEVYYPFLVIVCVMLFPYPLAAVASLPGWVGGGIWSACFRSSV